MVAASILFLVLGSLHTSYGPAIPGLRSRLDLAEDVAGLLPSSHFLGAVLGISAAIILGRRISFRASLEWFGLSLLLGGFGLLISVTWTLMLLSAGLVGIGSGGLQVEVVAWLGRRFRTRARRVLNVVHAFLSLGFVLGPVGVALSPRATPFVEFFVAIVVGISVLLVLRHAAGAERAGSQDAEGSVRYRPPGGVVFLAVLLGFYVGLEVGIGTWVPTHLVAEGATETQAATLTALFWGGFSLSRTLAGFVPERIDDRTIILFGLFGTAVVLLSAYPTGLLVPAYAVAGVILGPVFPTALTWASRRYALSTSSTGVLLLGSMSGGIVFPPLMGSVIARSGVDVLPLIMAILALACSVVFLGMRRFQVITAEGPELGS